MGDEWVGEFDDWREASGDSESEDRESQAIETRGRPKLAAGERGSSPVRGLSVVEVRARAMAAGLSSGGEAVLRLLFRHKVLRGEHLRALVFRGKSLATSRRQAYTLLAGLKREGFVERVQLAEGESPAYVLGGAGRSWVRYREGLKSEPRDQTELIGTRGDKLKHDALIADFVVPIILDVEGLGGSVGWYSGLGNIDRRGYKFVMWDAYLDIELAGQRTQYFLEMDRETENLSYFAGKVGKYAEYRQSKEWRSTLAIDFFPDVLVVTTGDERRLHGMRTRALQFAKYQDKLDPELTGWYFTNGARLRGITNPLGEYIWEPAKDDGDEGYYRMMGLDHFLTVAEKEWQKLDAKISEAKAKSEIEWLQIERAAAYQVYTRIKNRLDARGEDYALPAPIAPE